MLIYYKIRFDRDETEQEKNARLKYIQRGLGIVTKNLSDELKVKITKTSLEEQNE